MKARSSLITVAVLGALMLLVANATAGSGGDGASTAAATTVSMGDNFFSPAKKKVKPGTQVTWKNNGQVEHSATANKGSFDTGLLNPGKSRSVTFSRLGKFPYFCTVHPNMTGVIKVCKRKNGVLICSK
jgi:plastocyanin